MYYLEQTVKFSNTNSIFKAETIIIYNAKLVVPIEDRNLGLSVYNTYNNILDVLYKRFENLKIITCMHAKFI